MAHPTEVPATPGNGATLFVPCSTAARAAGVSPDVLTRMALKGAIGVQHRPGRPPRFNLADAQALATTAGA